jgi:hypothetical protein
MIPTGRPDFAFLKEKGLLNLKDTEHPLVSVNCYNGIENLFIGYTKEMTTI